MTPAVFLDYDGTLTPIVERPEDALLPETVRSAVERLASRCHVAVISGRDLDDVRRMVGIDGIFCAGSHGFDLAGPGGFVEQHAVRVRSRAGSSRSGAPLAALDHTERSARAQALRDRGARSAGRRAEGAGGGGGGRPHRPRARIASQERRQEGVRASPESGVGQGPGPASTDARAGTRSRGRRPRVRRRRRDRRRRLRGCQGSRARRGGARRGRRSSDVCPLLAGGPRARSGPSSRSWRRPACPRGRGSTRKRYAEAS